MKNIYLKVSVQLNYLMQMKWSVVRRRYLVIERLLVTTSNHWCHYGKLIVKI